MKNLILTLWLIIPLSAGYAQVAINNDNSAPDNSAMLEIKSSSRGLLPPRMKTSERTGIGLPADGLIVYDTDTKSLWLYKAGTGWKELMVNDRVAFKGYLTADQVFSSGSSIVFNAEEFDDGNNFVGTSPFGYFQAPADGVYHFDINIAAVNSAGGYQIELYKTISGGPTSRIHYNIIRPSSTTFVVSTAIGYTLRLQANDILRVWMTPITGTVTVKAGADQSFFAGYKVY